MSLWRFYSAATTNSKLDYWEMLDLGVVENEISYEVTN